MLSLNGPISGFWNFRDFLAVLFTFLVELQLWFVNLQPRTKVKDKGYADTCFSFSAGKFCIITFQDQDSLLVKRRNDNHSPDLWLGN